MLLWRAQSDENRYVGEDALPPVDGFKTVARLEGTIGVKGDISPDLIHNRYTDCLTVLDSARSGEKRIATFLSSHAFMDRVSQAQAFLCLSG